jgi:hypothetical protein
MTDLFISYAHADNGLVFGEFSVQRLTETLQDRGYRLWMDVLSIPGGSEWAAEIEKGIRNARYVLVIATENAARSSYIAEEIRLAGKHSKPIIPIFFESRHLTTLNLKEVQGINFGQPFDTALEKLIAALSLATPVSDQLSHVDLRNILDDGTITFGDAEKRWRTALPFGSKANAPVGLLIGRSPRGMNAFLVGRRDEQVTSPDVVQVFLQFTNRINEPVFDTYLQYIEARPNKALWTILVRAPIIHVEGEGYVFSLSDSDKSQWEEAVNFILTEALPRGRGTCRHVELYLQAPGALIMALGLKERFDFQCDVYHFSRGNSPKEQRYNLIYSLQSK